MLNELTGLLNYSQINDYKNLVRMRQDCAKNRERIQCIDTFVGSKENQDLRRFAREQEIEDVRKIINKTTPEDFSSIFKKACEKVMKR